MRHLLIILALTVFACKDNTDAEKTANPTKTDTVEKPAPETYKSASHNSPNLQKYYMVFLKRSGKQLDSLNNAKVTTQHQDYLNQLKTKGHANIHGRFADHGDMREMVVLHTANRKMADSLAKADPAVKTGIYTVEIHPWWAEKGAKLE